MVFPTDKSKDTRDPKEESIKEDAESQNLQGKSHSAQARISRDPCEQDSLMTATERSSSEKKFAEYDKLLLTVAFSLEQRQNAGRSSAEIKIHVSLFINPGRVEIRALFMSSRARY